MKMIHFRNKTSWFVDSKRIVVEVKIRAAIQGLFASRKEKERLLFAVAMA
jgi:hypothetical protein